MVGLSATYDDDAAALAGMKTAGVDTFTLAEVDDNDGILVAYKTTAGDVNIAVAQFNGDVTTSNLTDALSTIATIDGLTSLANLGDGELIVA